MADRLRLEQVAKTDPNQIVSTPVQLQNDAEVCCQGAPTHTPDRPRQSCIDNDSGIVYNWWAGTWTHE